MMEVGNTFLICYHVTMLPCYLPSCYCGVVNPILVAHPLHCLRGQHLGSWVHAETGKTVSILVQPSAKSVAAYSGRFCQLIFVHCFHATKLLKINDIRKFFARFFAAITSNNSQWFAMRGKDHQHQ